MNKQWAINAAVYPDRHGGIELIERNMPILPETLQILQARQKWQFTGAYRPDFAEAAAASEESVWDFPRPPVAQPVKQLLRVLNGDRLVAETRCGVRVIETGGAPSYYFPPLDVDEEAVNFGDLSSACEWKGIAQIARVGEINNAGWRYVKMFEAFAELFEWVSFFPGTLRCFVGDERVSQQPGGYYGGWVTANLRGPIKGGPGSEGW